MFTNIEAKDGRRFSAKRVILAMGGKAAPKLGGTGSGSALAAKLGHSVIQEHPALTPLLSDPKRMRPLKGMRCRGTVSLLADGKEAGKEEGEVQFTGEGLSGICVFQLSGRCGELLSEGKSVSLALDLMPDRNTDALKSDRRTVPPFPGSPDSGCAVRLCQSACRKGSREGSTGKNHAQSGGRLLF